MNLEENYNQLVAQHLAQRPAMQPRDVYKLLFQGVRGPEHIIGSPEAFRQRLAEEWDGLDNLAGDPLLEVIRPDGNLLRVNLRPYQAAGGSLEILADACLETGNRRWGTRDELVQAWVGFVAARREGAFPVFGLEDVEAFNSWLEEMEFPPVHHSKQYRSLYQPAYRLVTADLKQYNSVLEACK